MAFYGTYDVGMEDCFFPHVYGRENQYLMKNLFNANDMQIRQYKRRKHWMRPWQICEEKERGWTAWSVPEFCVNRYCLQQMLKWDRLAGYTVVVLEREIENVISLVECYYFHP